MLRLIAPMLALLLLACHALPLATADDDKKPAGAEDTPTITPDKPIDLFNGKDLDGWQFDVAGESDPAKLYRVEDGLIKVAGNPKGVMRTKRFYKDYLLEVQWRWPGKGGNSGVLIHSSKPRERNVWPKSLEVQLQSKDAGDFWVIGESVRVKDAEKRTKGRRTKNYTDGSEKTLGEWNTLIVHVRGDTVKVYINGELVNEAWDCSTDKGAICLQSEGTAVEFRKVQVRPLPEAD